MATTRQIRWAEDIRHTAARVIEAYIAAPRPGDDVGRFRRALDLIKARSAEYAEWWIGNRDLLTDKLVDKLLYEDRRAKALRAIAAGLRDPLGMKPRALRYLLYLYDSGAAPDLPWSVRERVQAAHDLMENAEQERRHSISGLHWQLYERGNGPETLAEREALRQAIDEAERQPLSYWVDRVRSTRAAAVEAMQGKA